MFRGTSVLQAMLMAAAVNATAIAAEIKPGDKFVFSEQNFFQDSKTYELDCTEKLPIGDFECGKFMVTPSLEIYTKEGTARGIIAVWQPFVPGSTWANVYFKKHKECGHVTYELMATASKTPETVSVNGAKYSAYRIEHKGMYWFDCGKGKREGKVEWTVWYDPSVPLPVKQREVLMREIRIAGGGAQVDRITELVSYKTK